MKGEFTVEKWDEKDGHVLRSAENDRRNKSKELSYTSIIIDATKTANQP